MTDRSTPIPDNSPPASPDALEKPPAPPKAPGSPLVVAKPQPVVAPIPPPSLRQRYGTAALLEQRPGVAFPPHTPASPPKEKKKGPGDKQQRPVTIAPEDVKTLLPTLMNVQEKARELGLLREQPVTIAPEDVKTVLPLSEEQADHLRKLGDQVLGPKKSSPPSVLHRGRDWYGQLSPRARWGAAAAVVAIAALVLFQNRSEENQTQEAKVDPPADSVPASALGTSATEAELQTAKADGVSSLKALAEKYPKDGAVLASYARALTKDGKHADAVGQARAALELDPALSRNEQLATVLWMGAQSGASSSAFELLQTKMGPKGADILYDLATTDSVRASARKTARQDLETARYARQATAQAYIAADLLTAPDCATRKALLKRAGNVGDERSRVLLESFRDGKGCGEREPKPCNACLKGSAELSAAIEQISHHPAPPAR